MGVVKIYNYIDVVSGCCKEVYTFPHSKGSKSPALEGDLPLYSSFLSYLPALPVFSG